MFCNQTRYSCVFVLGSYYSGNCLYRVLLFFKCGALYMGTTFFRDYFRMHNGKKYSFSFSVATSSLKRKCWLTFGITNAGTICFKVFHSLIKMLINSKSDDEVESSYGWSRFLFRMPRHLCAILVLCLCLCSVLVCRAYASSAVPLPFNSERSRS